MNGASAKVKPIPERPIAYAVASLFRKYSAVTTEKDWYSSAKPIPRWSERGCYLIMNTFLLRYIEKRMKNAVKTTAGELLREGVLTNYHSHTDIEEHHAVCENTYDEASTDQERPSDGSHPDSKLAAGHRGKRCYR